MSEFADLRQRANARGTDSFQMRCPSHDDQTASLSVKDRGDGSALVHCFAGCEFQAIRKALGLSTGKAPSRDTAPVVKQLVAQYGYQNATGEVIATKRRYLPKTFDWISRDDSGTVRPGLGKSGQSALPLYRFPDVLAAVDANRRVYVVEGERDSDNVAALGLTATTNPEGAGLAKWPEDRWSPLAGADVVILPDNDDAGRKHGERIAAALLPLAASVRVLHLPNLPEKGDVSDWLDAGGTREALEALADAAPPMRTARVRDGATLATELVATIKRFVVLGDDAARALALWIMHTHAFEATEAFTPYVWLLSPTRAAGKTTAMDTLVALVAEPQRADSISAAALYRKVDRGRGRGKPTGRAPTLFLDELDAVFGSGGAASEGLRGCLNSGYKADGVFTVCDGDDNEPRDYCTFAPKCLAGIGKALPDTVADRSIPIRLSRATREELQHIEKAHHRALAKLSDLRDDVAAWAVTAVPLLMARDEPYAGLSSRQDDIWGPLLNIADLCGGDWPTLAREAAHSLHAENGDSTDGRDPGTAMLADLREIFRDDGADFVTSARLAELLRLMENRPWPEYTRGGAISTHAIARLLHAYEISPRLGRATGADGKRLRGYHLDDCREAFRRYLPAIEPEDSPEYASALERTAFPAVRPLTPRREPAHTTFSEAAVPLTTEGFPASWA